MFKSSEKLRQEADRRSLDRVASTWRSSRATWFDGTPEAIEARLAATERLLTVARSGYTPAHLELTVEAETARKELLAAKHRLLVDFLDDGARAFKGSKRVAYELRHTVCAECGQDIEGDVDGDGSEPFLDRGRNAHGSDGHEHYPEEWTERYMEGSKRVAGAHDADPDAPWRNTMADEPYASLTPTPDFADLPLDGDYEGRHRSPLGPGYDRPGFGPEDIAEYEDHLRHHDYHTGARIPDFDDALLFDQG